MKKDKSPMKGLSKQAHTSNAKVGMGTFLGSGVKNPMGKAKVLMGKTISTKTKGNPPKSLA